MGWYNIVWFRWWVGVSGWWCFVLFGVVLLFGELVLWVGLLGLVCGCGRFVLVDW